MDGVTPNFTAGEPGDNLGSLATRTTIVIPILIIGICINACCIVIPLSSQHLKRNKFYILTMLHSLSDVGTCVFSGLMILLEMTRPSNGIVCVSGVSLLMGTIITSLYQTVLICVHQLVMVFGTSNSVFQQLINKRGMAVAYGLIQAYCLAIYFRYSDETSTHCTLSAIIDKEDISIVTLSIYVPVLLFTTLIISLYIILISKIYQKHQQVHPLSTVVAKRLKHYAITLGIVIAVSFMAILPNCFYSIIFLSSPDNKNDTVRRITNSVYIMKPLIDPVVYILRIRQFRALLCSGCCKPTSNSVAPQAQLNFINAM